jgi:oligosaccharide repeat unit polymerase
MVVAFCILSCLFVLLVLRRFRAYGGSTIVSPIGLFAAFFSFVYFVLPGLQEAFKINTLDHNFYGKDSLATVGTIALPLLYFAICALFFGFNRPVLATPAHLRRAALASSPAERGLLPILFALQLGSLIAVVQLIRSLSVVSYAQLLMGRGETLRGMGYLIDPNIVGYTAALIIAAPSFAAERIPRGWRGFAVLFGILAAAIPSAYLGKRLIALVGVAYLLLAYAILRKKKFPTVKVALGLLLILSIIAAMGIVRVQLLKTGSMDSNQVKEEIYSGKFLIDELTGSFGQLEWMGYLLEHEDRWHLQYGATYASVIVAPIPRVLWADKPAGAGPIVNDIVFQTGEWTGGMTAGCVMEAYLNGGLLGLMLVAAIHGSLLAAVTKYGTRVRYRHQVVVYMLLLACLGEMLIYGEFYGVAIRIAIFVLPVVLYTGVAARVRGSTAHRRARISRAGSPNAVQPATVSKEHITLEES